MEQQIGRNLALELVRVTEAAALTAGRWMGRGQKEAADQAAVDAMRTTLLLFCALYAASALLYAFFCALCIKGYIDWRKSLVASA